jgi:hypothetical protein
MALKGGQTMDQDILNFIQDKQIDSFPKLRFLLFLRQHPHLSGCPQKLAELMYVETPLVEKIANDLQRVGLLEGGHDNGYNLINEPDLKTWLEKLAKAFEHPLARQELLAQVSKPGHTSHNRRGRLDSSHFESRKSNSRLELFIPLK